MKQKPNANQVFNGTFGKVYVNGEKLANIKSFEAKLTFNFEEINIAEDTGTHQKYMGYSGEGTMTLHKVDSSIMQMLINDIKAGKFPDIMVVGMISDPAAIGAERVQLNEVTYDEATLLKFEEKTVSEEEVPFKFADFEMLDMAV